MLNTESEREAARILAKIGATSADPEIRAKLVAALEAAERRGRRQSRGDKQSSG
jgi:hypothetical protein